MQGVCNAPACTCCVCDRCHANRPPARRLDECHRVLQAGARVLTLDQLEGLKVRLAGCPASCLAAWLTVECAAAMTGQPVAGSLGLLPINHLVLWPVPLIVWRAIHSVDCRILVCPAGQMRPTVMATRLACGPPTACSPALPSHAALATQVGCRACCTLPKATLVAQTNGPCCGAASQHRSIASWSRHAWWLSSISCRNRCWSSLAAPALVRLRAHVTLYPS